MGALVGLLAGTGLLLVWRGLVTDRRPERLPRRGVRWREHLAQAGLGGVSPLQLLGVQSALGLLVLTACFAATRSISVSALFGIFGFGTPMMLVARLRRRRQSDLRELWPEVVDNLTSGVRAGLSLPEALSAIGSRGPEQLREPFRQFGTDYRATGNFNESVDRLKEALADPVGDRVCESLRVAREVGGTDLGRLLSTLGTFLRDDGRVRSELLARQSWSVTAARMATAAPWLVLLLLGTQRETLTAYDTPAGTLILVAGAGLSILAYRLMVRLGRLPEDRRVLR